MRRRATHDIIDSPTAMRDFERVMGRMNEDPESVALELLIAQRSCNEAAVAVEGMEKMMKDFVEGNASLFHVENIRELGDGSVRVICRVGTQLREFGVHPNIDVEQLGRLQPWEFVCVNEDVVVSLWNNDPDLFTNAKGEIVEFKGYADRELGQVRIGRAGHEESIVTLTGLLRLNPLRPGVRLILQRDDPRWAIATLPAETSESRFEVPLDQVHARLEDLAGIESVAERFIEDVLLRVVFSEVRDRFDLAPLRGALLYSYKPGMGKTKFMTCYAAFLRDFGREGNRFDTVLYHIKPNQLKSMWWGEDARIVREELWGSIRARQAVPRERPLIQLVVFDEIDSLQKRSNGDQAVTTSSHSDALEALLVEMEGLVNNSQAEGPPAHVLCVGMTNLPDRIDEALKRPGRFGDLVASMPDITRESAEDILAIYAAHTTLPWAIGGQIRQGVAIDEIRSHFLRPAVARLFSAVVARYATDSQKSIDVTAGEVMAGVHYEDTMKRAKRRAALRLVRGQGMPAITVEDVLDCLLESALDVAKQMEADPAMLVRQLRVRVPVSRVESVPLKELEQHRYLRVHTAS